MNHDDREGSSKVPEVTLTFWIIKVAATTLGETAGDAVSMSMNLGYLVGTGIFAALFVGAVLLQISAKRFHPALYWTTIIASTTVGTTLADFTDRSLGVVPAVLPGAVPLADLLGEEPERGRRVDGDVDLPDDVQRPLRSACALNAPS